MKTNKVLFLIVLLITNLSIDAQTKKVTQSIGPIMILLDSISPKKSTWGDYIIQYNDINSNRTTEILRVDASSNDIGKIIEIKQVDQKIFIIPIYELLVGYDYFIVIKSLPTNYFISKKFNFNGDKYIIDKNNINVNNCPFYILICKNNKSEKIKLYNLFLQKRKK
ncbi:MAG: hypothetical protein Q8862_01580 [Bacteroidota bacterium]|nr:hypothetical protein [Bacteroidota bacterium]